MYKKHTCCLILDLMNNYPVVWISVNSVSLSWIGLHWTSLELDVPDCLYHLLPSKNQCIKSLNSVQNYEQLQSVAKILPSCSWKKC